MQAIPNFGHEQIVTEILRGILNTVADQAGQSPERRAIAQQTAVCSVMAFNPRDPVETMLAGQCIVYDALMRDGARDMLRGQAELIKIKARPGILAAGKMFLSTAEMLSRMQGRAADQLAFGRPLEPAAPPATAEPPPEAADPVTSDEPAEAQTSAPATRATPVAPAKPAVPAAAPLVSPAARPSAPRQPAFATGRPDAVAAAEPGPTAASPLEKLEEVLLNGLTPAEKQDIRDSVAGRIRAAV